MIYADPNTGDCIEGASAPQGRFTVPLDDAAAYAAWFAAQNFPPPAETPTPRHIPAVDKAQILLELNVSEPRITFAEIEALLPQVITDPVELEGAYIELENRKTWERNHPLVPVIQAHLGVSDEWLDARWLNAATR